MASTTASDSAASDMATPILPENSSTSTRSVSATGSAENAPARRASSRWRAVSSSHASSSASARAMRQASHSQRSSSSSESALVTERAQRDLQRRRPRDVALAGEDGEPVQQQVAGTGRGLPVSGQNGGGDLARIASTHQAVGGLRSRERFEVCLAREPGIQRLEPLGRIEQQGGASRPRVVAKVICACNSWARACSSSSRGPALATASSRSAASFAAAWCLPFAARSARCARRLGSGVSSTARS